MVEELITQLESGTSSERKSAAEELGKLGPEAAAARMPLVAALIDKPAVRLAAARALMTVRTCPDSVFPIIYDMLDDDNVRYTSALVLVALGLDGPRGMEMVRVWIHSDAPDVRLTAVRFMEHLDVEPHTEHELLKGYIQDESDEDNITFAFDRFKALGPASHADVIPLLVSMADGGKAMYEIACFLADLEIAAARESLLTMLTSDNDHCKMAAAESLLNVGGDPALKAAAALRELVAKNRSDDPLSEKALALLSTLRD